MRDYIVLERQGPDAPEPHQRTWREITRVEAANDQQAIRKATDTRPAAERAGVFVAVPARSFKPRTRATETVVRDLWS
jgi:hypothetical protein